MGVSISRVCLRINVLVFLLVSLGYVAHVAPEWTDVSSQILAVSIRSLSPKAVKRIENRSAIVTLLHIPKTGGTSLYRQFKQDGVTFEHGSPYLDEWCFHDLNRTGEEYILSVFRNPLHHVYSLHLECKYDDWGKKATRNTIFPRDPAENISQGHVPAFERWLDHFGYRNESHSGVQGVRTRNFDDFHC